MSRRATIGYTPENSTAKYLVKKVAIGRVHAADQVEAIAAQTSVGEPMSAIDRYQELRATPIMSAHSPYAIQMHADKIRAAAVEAEKQATLERAAFLQRSASEQFAALVAVSVAVLAHPEV